MKNTLKSIIAIVLVSFVCFLGYKITAKINYKTAVAARIKNIPTFSFLDLQGRIFTEESLKNKSTVFIYFNSDCDYCQSEATKIQQRLPDFKNTQLIFVSFEKNDSIAQFSKKYQLDNKDNVTFLEDTNGEFSKIFDVNSIPYIVVYDTNKKLLQKFKGATKIDKILAVLK
ncbi:peroxiredoxin family protein [Tenacibaculum dicentrarchi]|uniref:peroxiredoxin family protein n=1 Tax=Tenacibaculum dicentrarchi TaxID=669041 RepID=UPI003511D287